MSSPERLEQLRRIVDLDPQDAVAHWGLGRALAAAGDSLGAERAFSRAVELAPRYSAAYRDLGRAQLDLDRAAQAIETFDAGLVVAREQGDLQTVREMEVFRRRAARRLEA